MKEEVFQNILIAIRTTHELENLLDRIDEILNELYIVNHKNLESILSSELPSGISTPIKELFAKEHIDPNQPDSIKNAMTSLKTSLQTTSVLTLTIAFSPSDEQISHFAKKTKELFGYKTVLEMNTLENIVGGAIIVYKGKYIDASLQNKVKRVFQTNQKEIASLHS